MIRSLKKALQPSANNVAVTFEVPSNYQVKVIPEKIPSIYNGEKTVIYGLLMEKSEQKGENVKCKATLTGDIIGKKFKFDIPFELTEGQSEKEDVSVIHQLAVKGMIQEWQDDEGPYEQKHKKEIIELSTDASVVSRYTAYIAVDVAQNKPVSGSMQGYELTAGDAEFGLESMLVTLPAKSTRGSTRSFNAFPPAYQASCAPPPPSGALPQGFGRLPPLGCSLPRSHGIMGAPRPPPPGAMPFSFGPEFKSLPPLGATGLYGASRPLPLGSMGDMGGMKPSQQSPGSTMSVPLPPAKKTGSSFIVSLQQANGSWLLNDQLAGVVSKSVEELKSCCPVSCDDTVMANIWATLVVIELLKKKYPSMLDELELVIMKAEQWLHKQVLPSGVNLAILKENAVKLL